MYVIKLKDFDKATLKVRVVARHTYECREEAVEAWHKFHSELKGEESMTSNFDPRV